MFLWLSPNPGHPTPDRSRTKKKPKKNPRTIGFVQKQRLGGQLETARCSGPYLSSGLCFTSSTDIPKTNDQKMAEDPLSLDLRVIFIEPCRVPSFCQNLLTPRAQRLYVHFRGIALSLSHFLSLSLSLSFSSPLLLSLLDTICVCEAEADLYLDISEEEPPSFKTAFLSLV